MENGATLEGGAELRTMKWLQGWSRFGSTFFLSVARAGLKGPFDITTTKILLPDFAAHKSYDLANVITAFNPALDIQTHGINCL